VSSLVRYRQALGDFVARCRPGLARADGGGPDLRPVEGGLA
jgi:hypothetical protein